jgi:putative Mg2+ transporter-C (MgtC) family protein
VSNNSFSDFSFPTPNAIFLTVNADLYALAQAAISVVLGGVVGWERERAGKGAGLRTHMLLCLAATMFMRVGDFLMTHAHATQDHVTLRTDPIPLISAIVTGVSFLGAGTIFRDPDVRRASGLTTAASLLVVATIGISIALDRYILAVGIAILALLVLRVVFRLEHKQPEKSTTTE